MTAVNHQLEPACNFRLRRLSFVFATAVLVSQAASSGTLLAQDLDRWLGPSHPKVSSRDSWGMMKLVRPLCDSVGESVVQVLSGGRLVSLGTVVSEDGYVLTKKSELTGDPVSVRLPSGEKVSARVAVVRPSNDLALIKLENGDENPWTLKPAKFVSPEPDTGSFVISSGRDGKSLGIGVLGVNSREVSHRGRLGVRFFDSPTAPVTIHRVAPLSGAEQAGLQGGDAILKIDNQRLYSSQSAIQLLGTKYYPGDVLSLTVRRGEDTFETKARMSEQSILMESENDAAVNGPRNLRLSGFDAVLQHDTVLLPNQCGGPLLDSSGNVIGLNIARAGRVVSYALPSSLINAEIVSMLSEARG